jgi:hypothetical protein
MNVNFKSSIEQGKLLRFGKSNDNKKTLFVNKDYIPPSTLKNNLLIYWNFESESINPAFQADNYTVQQAGTPTYINDGPAGAKAVRLTPNNRIILRNNLWNFPTSPTSFTVCFWIRKNASNTTGQQAVYLGSCFGNMAFYFSENGGDFRLPGMGEAADTVNNNLCFSLLSSTSPEYLRVKQVIPPPSNQWFFVAGTYDINTKLAILYKNGAAVGSQDFSAYNLSFRNNNWNGIALNGSVVTTDGSEYGNNYDYAYVSLWNRVLSDTELLSLYNNPSILN